MDRGSAVVHRSSRLLERQERCCLFHLPPHGGQPPVHETAGKLGCPAKLLRVAFGGLLPVGDVSCPCPLGDPKAPSRCNRGAAWP
jgi:hypothetical protein